MSTTHACAPHRRHARSAVDILKSCDPIRPGKFWMHVGFRRDPNILIMDGETFLRKLVEALNGDANEISPYVRRRRPRATELPRVCP
jgi:hypothetical protein